MTAGGFPLKLALAFACLTTCLIPGDAVADASGGRGPTKGGPAQNEPGRTSTAAQTRVLLSDMSNPSESLPEGVPPWFDWAAHPRTRSMGHLGTFRAFTAWGQLYQCAGTRATPGETVDLRDLQTWVLLRNSTRWRRIQFSSDLAGAAFAEDYAGPVLPGRYSASPTGTFAQLVSGHNFHFWPGSGRVSLNASELAAVAVAVEARLHPTAEPSARSCLVLSVGGDVWRSLTTAPGSSSSGDVGIGRFKRMLKHWRLFTMTTASHRVLHLVPLPAVSPSSDDF